MITGVHTVVAPQNPVAVDEHERRKRPRITVFGADEVPLQRRSDSAGDCARSEHLDHSSASDVERLVETLLRVGDGGGTWPQGFEEGGTRIGVTHEHEDDLGKSRVAPGDPAEVLDDLLGKQSTKMPEEDQQRRPTCQHVAQGAQCRLGPLDFECQGLYSDLVVHLAPYTRPAPWSDAARWAELSGLNLEPNGVLAPLR